ncbi:transposase, partial [Microbaculum marinum]
MKIHPRFVGCDVCKHHLDIFEADGGRTRRIDNSDEAIAAWLAGLPARSDRHIVFEATGRYDRRLAAGLEARGVCFSRVNPARARDFARALGVMAKTDRIDARLLAAMGQALEPAQTPAREDARDALAGLHKRRDQLVAMRQKEKVRLAEASPRER